MRTHNTVFIARPVEAVFAFVADLRNERRWQPEITEVRVTSAGPVGPGSTFIEVRRTLGVELTWTFDVVAFEPLRCIGIRSTSGRLPYAGRRWFAAAPGGTLVTEEGELTLPRVLRPLGGTLAALSRRPVAQAYDNLKRLLEAEGGGPAPRRGRPAATRSGRRSRWTAAGRRS